MALVVADRVKETTTTTGTGTYTLAGAATGFESFSAIGNGNTTYYCCTDGTDFEVGIGTYTASGTTLARTTILQSSNSDAAVNWSAGTRDIFVTQPAEKAVFLDGSGNISIPGTIDGRDLATDGTKLDGIEASADVTDTANVTAAGALMDSEVTNLAQVKAFDSSDYATAAQGTTADAALPKAGGQMTGNITFSGSQTVDGRDLSADGTKLDGIESNATADQTAAEIRTLVESATDSNVFTDADHTKLNGIEASADVTDTTNVTAAGALMDSEVTNLAQVKAFDSSDYATAAQGSTADSAMQDLSDDTTPQLGGNLDLNSKAITGTGHLEPVAGTTYTPPSGAGSDTSTDVALALRRDDHIVVGHNGYVRRLLHANSSGDIHVGHSTATGLLGNVKIYPGSGGSTEIYHKGTNLKIDTTDAGIDVTGNIAVSGTVDGRDLATDGTKLDGIEAGADVTDTTNVTAAGALMDSEVTNLSQVKAFNSSDYATAAQGTTADAAMPKAGGTFTGDVTFTGANYNIVFDKSDDALEFADNAKAVFGTGGDLEIYHSGSHSIITDGGTGNLSLQTNGGEIQISKGGSFEHMFRAIPDAQVELYYDNSKKLETASGGISVTGEVAATSLDISGDVDVDGTLEADAITVNGTALAASATTDTTNASNISSGTLPNARLDAQLQDVAGLAVTNGNFIVGDGSNFVAESGATARTSLGLGTAAVAATGISNGNVPVFTSGVADDDFLRVSGTSIEGRSASEVVSDLGLGDLDFGLITGSAASSQDYGAIT